MKSAAVKSAAKGQKSIAAFFGAPKPAAASKPSPDTPADAEALEARPTPVPRSHDAKKLQKRRAGVSAKAERSGPKPKRARSTTGASNEQTVQRTEQPRASPSAAVDLTDPDESAPQHTANDAEQRAMQPSEASAKTLQRDPARHALARRKFAVRKQRMVLGADDSNTLEKGAKYTPLERQVMDLKKRNPGKVLLIECGYKFRFFGEDADLAARHLNIFSFADHNFMTASIPLHRLHVYVRRLVRLGHKVAVVRQMETAALKAASDNKGKVFERKVAAVYTPATLEAGAEADVGADGGAAAGDDAAAAAPSSSYLMCVREVDAGAGRGDVAFTAMEPTLSSIYWGCCRDRAGGATLESALMFFQPRELLVAGDLSADATRLLKAFVATSGGCTLEDVPAAKSAKATLLQEIAALCTGSDASKQAFEEQAATLDDAVLASLLGAFQYLKGLGLELWNEAGLALRPLTDPGHMTLGSNALAQLHVLEGVDGKLAGSLLEIAGQTKTRGGARLLRQWLSQPLVCGDSIAERQAAVAELLESDDLSQRVRETLTGLPDLDRTVGRAFLQRASASEFVTAMAAFAALPRDLLGAVDSTADRSSEDASMLEASSLGGVKSVLLRGTLRTACDPEMVRHALEHLGLLNREAAAENDMLRLFASRERFPGVHQRHAELAAAEAALQDLLPGLAKLAGTHKLTYKSIQNQGDYLIELPADMKAPSAWLKVSTTKKFNRFRPAVVAQAVAHKDCAYELLQAECQRAWAQFLADFAPACRAFRAAAQALATLDCLQSHAATAAREGFCRPEFLADEAPASVSIRGGRAPLLDHALASGAVPNDVALCEEGLRMMVISGPNMGGKSCYMCTVAQLVLLAQAGCWVPADAMRLTVMDAIHTRMGAHDNILQGRSTFLEELLDTSRLLAAATPRSLVILDELGRGTATHDGVAIAVAAMEHVALRLRCCCLFVTHYPEVCEAAGALAPHAQCCHMAYKVSGKWAQGQLPQPAPVADAQATGTTGADDAQDSARSAAASPSGQQQENERASCNDARRCDGAAGVVKSSAEPAAAVAKAAVAQQAIAEAAPQPVDKITFLYKVKEGAAGASFGLNVARLAGLPAAVTARASAIASCLTRDGRFQPPPRPQGGDCGDWGELPESDRRDLDVVRQCLNPQISDDQLKRLRAEAGEADIV